ncbi:MAG: dUTP diphosphatase [Chloroflexi bacterium]|nr:dUTP diphosphatase [Chloroflexota bacterium]
MSARPVLKVKRIRPGAILPCRATPGATAFDLYACIQGPDPVEVGRDPILIPTGIAVEVPRGYDAQIRPSSGLSSQGVAVPLGTIDSDYRGEVLVTMYVVGTRSAHIVRHGDRIAQLVVTALARLDVAEVHALSETQRGGGGHGSTGR